MSRTPKKKPAPRKPPRESLLFRLREGAAYNKAPTWMRALLKEAEKELADAWKEVHHHAPEMSMELPLHQGFDRVIDRERCRQDEQVAVTVVTVAQETSPITIDVEGDTPITIMRSKLRLQLTADRACRISHNGLTSMLYKGDKFDLTGTVNGFVGKGRNRDDDPF